MSEQPALATALIAALRDLRDVQLPSTDGLRVATDPTERFHCGGMLVGFDTRGAMSTLAEDAEAGAVWANDSHPLGLFEYQTFVNEDYNAFLAGGYTRNSLFCV